MNKILLLIGYIAFLSSCVGKGEEIPLIKTGKLEVGQTYVYDYGDARYEVKCLTDTTLRWECVFGEEKGRQETDRYYQKELDGNAVFVTWAEVDGIGVSQVIDFNKNKVQSYLLIDKKIELAEAKITKK
jgi:phenolic acid decarboxylase